MLMGNDSNGLMFGFLQRFIVVKSKLSSHIKDFLLYLSLRFPGKEDSEDISKAEMIFVRAVPTVPFMAVIC